VVEGRHVANLDAGRVLDRRPNVAAFRRLLRLMPHRDAKVSGRQLGRAYLATAVLTKERLRAVVGLLPIFAESLGVLAQQVIVANRGQYPAAIQRALAELQHRLNEPCRTREMARSAGVSEQYFCKLFKRTTGATFTDYLTRARVDRAEQLLRNPARKVTDIAHAVGFQSLSQFNRSFKRVVGKTPSDYRRALLRR
jgi:AraC-like DNA-binding protein